MQDDNHVLLGEDDLITAKCIKSNIEKNGYKIIRIVESGEELVTVALYECPSLIITDISLKGQLDGIEAMSRISEMREIPYIFHHRLLRLFLFNKKLQSSSILYTLKAL